MCSTIVRMRELLFLTLWRSCCDSLCCAFTGVVATDMFYDFVGSGEGLADMFKPLAVRIRPGAACHSLVSEAFAGRPSCRLLQATSAPALV